MRNKILTLVTIAILIGFSKLPTTGSLLSDSEDSSQNTFTAEEWTTLSFYSRQSLLSVGFKLENVESFDAINYKIDYLHDGGLAGHIEGLIDNSGSENTIVREGLALGGCSSLGEVCWDDEVEGNVNLTVELMQGAVVVETLTKSITI